MYSLNTMLNQFKTHVWSHLEYSNGALLLAKPAERRRLDKVQRGFLYEIGLNDEEAFINYNFGPPSLRRAIGILGFIHKRVLCKCHPALVQALPYVSDMTGRYHSRSLESFYDQVSTCWPLYFRSLWAYVNIYNRLSQGLVDTECIPTFQGKLTQIAKLRAQHGDPKWREAFQSEADVLLHVHNT